MFLCGPSAPPLGHGGGRACRGSAARRRAPLFPEPDWGKLHMPWGRTSAICGSGQPAALGKSLQNVSSALREEPALPWGRRERRLSTPAAPPAQPHLASLATEQRQREGSSEASRGLPAFYPPGFPRQAAAAARGPALQNGGCSLFAATGPRRFHPPYRGPRPRAPPPPPPSEVKLLTDVKREGGRREPALNSQPTRPSTRLLLRFSSLDKMAAAAYPARPYIRAARSHVTPERSKSEGAIQLIDSFPHPAAAARPRAAAAGTRAPPRRERGDGAGTGTRTGPIPSPQPTRPGETGDGGQAPGPCPRDAATRPRRPFRRPAVLPRRPGPLRSRPARVCGVRCGPRLPPGSGGKSAWR